MTAGGKRNGVTALEEDDECGPDVEEPDFTWCASAQSCSAMHNCLRLRIDSCIRCTASGLSSARGSAGCSSGPTSAGLSARTGKQANDATTSARSATATREQCGRTDELAIISNLRAIWDGLPNPGEASVPSARLPCEKSMAQSKVAA